MVRMRSEELSAGEWAVLALLAEKPTHGFAIARAMAPGGEIGKIWSFRRPLVYRALEILASQGLVDSLGKQPGERGPNREILKASPLGRRKVAKWLQEPVAHVRDARTLLLLKLLFLYRAGRDPTPLLETQRERFDELTRIHGQQLSEAEGFERTLALWRLETTTATLRFIDGATGLEHP